MTFLNHVTTSGTGDKTTQKKDPESIYSLKYKHHRTVQTGSIIRKRITQLFGSTAVCAG